MERREKQVWKDFNIKKRQVAYCRISCNWNKLENFIYKIFNHFFSMATIFFKK